MKQARSTVWVTALTYAKAVSQPLELWEKWWNWRNGICYSDITSVLQGKLRLFPSSPKERKQKLEYITRSIHICTTAEIE